MKNIVIIRVLKQKIDDEMSVLLPPNWYWSKTYELKHKLQVIVWRLKYPDYEDDEYNCGALKHIWGSNKPNSNLWTCDDITITYDRDDKKYLLGIETAYLFDNREEECVYLRELLDKFSDYMDGNNLSKENTFTLFMGNPRTSTSAYSIEELYTNFRIFVEGYCKVHNYERSN